MEVEGVLREKLQVPEQTILEAVTLLRSCCDIIDPVAEAAVGDLTPADNRILDCAFQGGVQYLVTGDKGIQRVETFQGVSIVGPAEFLELLIRHRSG
jgi:predicted nucleic acid-binding protein